MSEADKIYCIFKNTGESFYHAENTVNELYKICKQLEQEKSELIEAMEWFCQRVENGEVRSVKTYDRFKELIARQSRDKPV